MNISSIKWDYDSPNIAGTIFLETDIKEFEFDPNTKSQFEITNELWALLAD